MATVFVFEGRAYYGAPGVEWEMSTVQEDYAPARECKGTWTKTQSWLVSHGYRKLWGTPTHLSGRDGKQVWGLVSVFGDTNVTYTGAYAVKTRYEHWRQGNAQAVALHGLDTMRQYAQAGA